MTHSMIHVMNRRKFLEGSAMGAASLLVGCSSGPSEPTVAEPVTQTAQGAVRGTLAEEVYSFKGMRYGASTAGPRRFLPPAPVEAWEGEFDATNYGQEAPQPHPHTEIEEVRATIPEHEVGEDCLRLNVWTRGLADDARRPVMVWLHGGGFSSGNGGYDIYDGHNLAKTRDVVAISVNHRLNTFGFLDLTEIDPSAGASNVGMQDIVAALEWVRDNITNFGGDPENVTIYGQSGGGGKVSTLMAMPAAEGLFHKAIVMSGSELRGIPLEVATKGARELMAKLNAESLADLQALPMDQIIEASRGIRGMSGPVVDGVSLQRDPFTPDAPPMSANIPLLIGGTETEVTFFPNQQIDPIDEQTMLQRIRQATGADYNQAVELAQLYREGRPGIENIDVALIVESDARFRQGVLKEAVLKSEQSAPVYMYYFTWRSPVHEGKLKSMHTLDIPFALGNVDNAKSMTGDGEDRYALQDKMTATWTQFARTGNPNNNLLPNWPTFDTKTRATMILDDECKVVDDPNGAERIALQKLLNS